MKIPEGGNQSEEENIQFQESWEAWCLRHSNFEPVQTDNNPTTSMEPHSIFVILVCWFGFALSAIETAVERCQQ